MNIDFQIVDVRTMKSPSSDTVRTHFVWVDMQNLPENIPTDVNPREVNMKTATAKSLLAAVEGSDTNFDIQNRGIVILAKKVTVYESKDESNKVKILSLDLGEDRNRYGLLDGGHTYRAILDGRDNIQDGVRKFVKLEIIVGDEVDVSALSDARNTSVQVTDIALFNLENRFGFIKEVLKDQPYGDMVAYKDNEDKRIPISEILKLMYAFNLKRFDGDQSAPIAAYSGKATVFKDYKREWEENSKDDSPTESNIYLKLSKQIPKFVELYESIQKEMPEKFNEYKKTSGSVKPSFGKLRGVEVPKNKKQLTTTFNADNINYGISTGYIMPIFGAFRALLKQNDIGEFEWEIDPVKMWKEIGTKLVQSVLETETNPNLVGKSKPIWQSSYRVVENEKNKYLVAKLMAASQK